MRHNVSAENPSASSGRPRLAAKNAARRMGLAFKSSLFRLNIILQKCKLIHHDWQIGVPAVALWRLAGEADVPPVAG